MSGIVDLAREHALTLLVVAPFVGAALAGLGLHPRVSWAIAATASIVAAALAFDFGWRMLAGEPSGRSGLLLALAPDGLALFTAPLIAGAAALVLFAAGGLLKAWDRNVAPVMLALGACVGGGWTAAVVSRDLIGLALGVEIAWLASVGLVLISGARDRGSLNGALRMLSAGGVAAALMLLGIGFVGRGVGATELAALDSVRIAAPGLVAIGVGLVLAALAIKAAVAPLHLWAGAVFGRADALTAWLVGAVGVVGAIAALMRVAAHALAAPALGDGVALGLAALGTASVVIGSVQAIGARNLMRLAAYAGAAQAGCILVSVALGSQAGIAAALVQLLALAASALALVGGAAAAGGSHAMAALDGLGRRAPLAGVAVTAGALGLMGAPLTIGFLGRWRMIEAAVGVGWWWAACAAIAASLAGVFYGGRLIERVYFRRANTTVAGGADRWRFEFAPALIAAICVTAIGVEPSLLLNAVSAAAAMMIGGAP